MHYETEPRGLRIAQYKRHARVTGSGQHDATASPADAIRSSSRSLNVDIIVMGTHGREGLSRALLGSVAESVIQQSDRPVLTVRPIASRLKRLRPWVGDVPLTVRASL